MSLQEIGKARERESPDDPVGEWLAKRRRRGKCFDAGMTIPLFPLEPRARQLSHGSGDAVDDDRWIVVDELQERGAAPFNLRQRRRVDPHVLLHPGNPEE